MPRHARRGFTLVELLIGMVVFAVIGVGVTKMIVGQTRYADHQEAWRNARAVSRTSLNRLLSDLRMVEVGGGLEAAAAGGKDLTVRVPYAFGVVCASTPASLTASLLPVDSAMFAAPGFSGLAWRDAAGAYTYITAGVTLNIVGTAGLCTAVNITTLAAFNGSPPGRVVDIVAPLVPQPPVGSLIFLYRRVRYEFKASAALPGRTGLWRTLLSTGATEELATPFDTTARALFYVLDNPTPQTAVPGPLADTRGLEFRLDGMSEATPRGGAAPKVSAMTTSVFFQNRLN